MAPKIPTTTTYLLRDVDADLWARFRERADREGDSARDALLALVGAYADGHITIERRSVVSTNGARSSKRRRASTR